MTKIMSDAEHKALFLRGALGLGNNDPVSIFDILKYKENITIIKTPLSPNFSGMIVKKGDVKAIVINSNMSLGRQIFSAAHEYYHLKFDIDLNNHSEKTEREAHQFASYFLMPKSALENTIFERLNKEKRKVNIADVLFLENYYKLSHKAVLFRLKLEKIITSAEYDDLNNVKITSAATSYGYSTELYRSTNEEMEIHSNYLEAAKKAFEQNKISSGKYESYMIEGGYEEIVFGFIDESEEEYEDDLKNYI